MVENLGCDVPIHAVFTPDFGNLTQVLRVTNRVEQLLLLSSMIFV